MGAQIGDLRIRLDAIGGELAIGAAGGRESGAALRELGGLIGKVETLRADDTGAWVWIVHVPRHAPRQPVVAHAQAWQRDHDKLVTLRPDRLAAILGQDLNEQVDAKMVINRARKWKAVGDGTGGHV